MNGKALLTLLFGLGAGFLLLGPAAAAPDDDYRACLARIPATSDTAVEAGLGCLKSYMEYESSPARRDTAILAFRAGFESRIEFLNAQLETHPELGEDLKPRLRREGLVLDQSEGMFYIREDADFFYNRAARFGSPALRSFFAERRREIRERFSEDAGLLVSWSEVARRALFWADWLDSHPTAIMSLKYDATWWATVYLETLLTGMDNSPAFEWASGRLKPEVKRAHEETIRARPESRVGQLLMEYHELLRRHDWKTGDHVTEFLRARNFESMQGVQPPAM